MTYIYDTFTLDMPLMYSLQTLVKHGQMEATRGNLMFFNINFSSSQLGYHTIEDRSYVITQVPALKDIQMRSASCGQLHVVYRTYNNRYFICGIYNKILNNIQVPLEIKEVNGISAARLSTIACTKLCTIFLSGN